jgi:hypothetical protein
MKTRTLPVPVAVLTFALAALAAVRPALAADARVGIYDSRIIAFAHFWSEPVRQERDALIAGARAAKAAGDDARYKELTARIKAEQDRSHLQVFSTAPATEAMAALQDRTPALQRELGVERFVSKWDEAALRDIPAANRVDATDRLAREFKPDEKRSKTIEQMKSVKPMPIDEAARKMKAGKL